MYFIQSVTVPINSVDELFIGKVQQRLQGWALGKPMIDGMVIP